jgi:hypothetical protein
MKTTKYIPVLGLALIFATVSAGYSKKAEDQNSQQLKVAMIKYQVNIHLAVDKPICNIYWVKIIDETGHLVAPTQLFIPGKNLYTFYSYKKENVFKERGTKRIAMLSTDPKFGNLECGNNLFTPSDVKAGFFLMGQTYTFDLYPLWDSRTDRN